MVSHTDLMKYMLNRPLITRRIGKWSFTLLEFTLIYFPQKSIKGLALADFLVDHPSLEIGVEQSVELGIYGAKKEPWILILKITLSFNMAFECTNNQAEYEAFVIGLQILLELGAKDVRVIGDS